jgi:hypothetical protein
MFILYFLKFSQLVNTIVGIILWFILDIGVFLVFYKGFKF